MTKPQCCRTCQHSRWRLTPTGEIHEDTDGECVVELPDWREFLRTQLPECATVLDSDYDICLHAIWPEDGTTCKAYELNEGKPIGEGTK